MNEELMSVHFGTKEAGQCPKCGDALDLWRRPVNVDFFRCRGCHAEYSLGWVAGYRFGMKRALELRNEAAERGSEKQAKYVFCGACLYRPQDENEVDDPCPKCGQEAWCDDFESD